MIVSRLGRLLRERLGGLLGEHRARERRLTEAQKLARLGSWEWDRKKERVLWSDELCRIFGVARGFSATHEQVLAMVHPDDREALARREVETRYAGEAASDYRIVRGDGEVRHVHGRRYARFSKRGELRRLFGTIQDVTDLRAAEQAHREARDLFEAAFAHAPIGMALVGLDGRWLRVNRAMCEIAGWTEDELLGRSFEDVTHPDDVDSDLLSRERLLRGEINGYQVDKRYRSPSGAPVWVNLSVSLVRGADGHPRHFIAQVQDISKRKRAELALEEERRALDEAQRIAHVGSWRWDARTDTATWSPEMYRIFGCDPSLPGLTRDQLLARVHPDDRERLAEEFDEKFGRAGEGVFSYRIVLDDGATRMVRQIGRVDPERHIHIGTVQDVTDLRQAELQARRERDYAAAIMSSMRDGFMLARDGVVLGVNHALCELTGFTTEELVGARAPYPFWPADAVEALTSWLRESEALESSELETTFERCDGSRFPVSVNMVAARSHDGRHLGFVSTIRDISERKRTEAELNRLATQDPLTGLANHRVFHEQLRAEFARAARRHQRLSVAVLDLDHFKRVNDEHGHPVGDDVLRETGRRLCKIMREGETLGRVGGEEFAWILPDTDEQGACAAAERARQAIRSRPFSHGGTVTLSAGVSELEYPDTVEELYRRADQALYRAKQSGRDRTVRHHAPDPLATAP